MLQACGLNTVANSLALYSRFYFYNMSKSTWPKSETSHYEIFIGLLSLLRMPR